MIRQTTIFLLGYNSSKTIFNISDGLAFSKAKKKISLTNIGEPVVFYENSRILGEAAKKMLSFFSGPATKALFRASKNDIFS